MSREIPRIVADVTRNIAVTRQTQMAADPVISAMKARLRIGSPLLKTTPALMRLQQEPTGAEWGFSSYFALQVT